MQPQTVKIARRLVRPSDPLSRNASLGGGVAARPEEGRERDFVSALFAFVAVFSQKCVFLSVAKRAVCSIKIEDVHTLM